MKVKIAPLASECPACNGSCHDQWSGERCNRCAGIGEITECECGEYLDPDKQHPAFLFFSDKIARRVCYRCAEDARADMVNFTEIADDGTPMLPAASTVAWTDELLRDIPTYRAWELPLGMKVVTFGGITGPLWYDKRAAKVYVAYKDKYAIRRKRFMDRDEVVALYERGK